MGGEGGEGWGVRRGGGGGGVGEEKEWLSVELSFLLEPARSVVAPQ